MKKNSSISRREVLSAVTSLSAIAVVPSFANGFIKRNNSHEQSFTGKELPIYSLNRKGSSRQFTTFDPKAKTKFYPIKPGEKRDLVHYEGTGIITRLWMTFSGWFWSWWEPNTYVDQTILKQLILRIYWDGNDYPSVEAPIGDFFGIGQCEYKQYVSKYIGMSGGGFYNYFPMPFNKGVRIEVENMHDKVISHVFLNANYQVLEKLPENAGYFHCLYHSGTKQGPEPFTILQAIGKGHYVGCCISMQGKEKDYLTFMEAPEYIYIDTKERTTPTIVGTGMEDYFNGGWYFRDGEFNSIYHGVPIKDALRSMVSMYRFHDQDAICFDESIEITFINPRPANRLKEYKFSSSAFWYQDKASKLAFELPPKDKLVNWYRIKDNDHLSIP